MATFAPHLHVDILHEDAYRKVLHAWSSHLRGAIATCRSLAVQLRSLHAQGSSQDVGSYVI